MPFDDIVIDANNSELLLINAIGDGDCFINAIFDYGLYTGTLNDIYNRLIHLELLIMSVAKYREGIQKAMALFKNPKLTLTDEKYTKILDNKLLKESYSDTVKFRERYKVPQEQVLTCYHHPYPQDRQADSPDYEKERNNFIKFMKYMQVLYIYTYGNKLFIKRLTHIFSNIALTKELLEGTDFDTGFIDYIKQNYYLLSGNLKKSMDIPKFLDDYMRYYATTDKYYTGSDQVLIFRKIFFKKLREKASSETIPRFWLNYEFQQNIKNATKRQKFIKILQEGLEEDKNKNLISIIRDGEHFKLFVYREQMVGVL